MQRTFVECAAKSRPLLVMATVAAVAIGTAGLRIGIAQGQEAEPGLTGISYPEDLVFARQLLMDDLEEMMPPIDAAATGGDFDVAALQNDVYLMSTIIGAFPHMFAPQTKPVVAPDGTPPLTTATDAIWEDFDDFYARAMDASNLAFEMSFANADEFRTMATDLRAACDSCHELYMMTTEPPR